MNRERAGKAPWYASRNTLAGIMLVAAVSVGIQIIGGASEYPVIPPGAVIFAAVGLVVAFVPWRWTPVFSLLASAFLTIGGLQAPEFLKRLTAPADFVGFFGTALELVCLFAGIVLSIAAIMHARLSPRAPTANAHQS